MKKISVVIPTFNEKDNITELYNRLCKVFSEQLSKYQYAIIFIDNYSTDGTRVAINKLCQTDKNTKAIFNAKNFGFSRSQFYGLTQADGDCVILMCADLQEPPEIIPQFVSQWEEGNKIVVGIKNKSKENRLMYASRSLYYKLSKHISDIEHIEHFTGFGAYDKSFISVIRKIDDPLPYLRGIVAELGFVHAKVYYTQEKRKHGKSKFSVFKLYDLAMLGITSYSKTIMRLATILGFVVAIASLIIALITLIIKLLYWDSYDIGIAAVSIGIFFFGAVQLFFIGFLAEYIVNINTRVMKHPLVVEEKRINF